MYTIEQLKQVGGTEWKSSDGKMHRVYFNLEALIDLYGLKIERYNTGNISAAWLDGAKFANRRASEVVWMLGRGKFWYDLADGKFYSRNLPDYSGKITHEIEARLEIAQQPNEEAAHA